MAKRLPTELVQDILLLNDDDVDLTTGSIANRLDLASTTDRSHSQITIKFLPPRPKRHASQMAQVTPPWAALIRRAPRLKLCHVFIRFRPMPFHDDLPVDSDLIRKSQASDMDVQIDHEGLPEGWASEPRVDGALKFLRGTSAQWRSLRIKASSNAFWEKLQQELTDLPRLLVAEFSSPVGCPYFLGPTTLARFPNLRYVSLFNPILCSVEDFKPFTNVTSLNLRSLAADNEESWENLDLQISASAKLPHLRHLSLEFALIPQTWVGIEAFLKNVITQIRPLPLAVLNLELCGRTVAVRMDRWGLQSHRQYIALGVPAPADLRKLVFALNSPALIPVLLEGLNPKYMEALDITIVTTPFICNELVTIPTSLPGLKVLRLKVDAKQSYKDRWFFITHFLGGIDAPHLEEIDFRGIGGTELTAGTPKSGEPTWCFKSLKIVQLEGWGYRSLSVLDELTPDNLRVLDIEKVESAWEYELTWQTASVQLRGVLEHAKEVRMTVPQCAKRFAFFLDKMQHTVALRLVLSCWSSYQALDALKPCDRLPRLKKLTIVRSNLPNADTALTLQAVLGVLKARSFTPPKTLVLMGFDKDSPEISRIDKFCESRDPKISTSWGE